MIKLKEWFNPIWSQPDCGLFSKEEKLDSKQIEYLAPEGAISTIVVIKWSEAIKGSRVKVDVPLCGVLYKEIYGAIVTLSGTHPYAKMNSFTWFKEDNDWTFLGDQYNEEFNN